MIIKIIPVCSHFLKTTLYVFLTIITCFLAPLVCMWYPSLRLKIQYSIVNFEDATQLCIYGKGILIYWIYYRWQNILYKA